MNLSVRRAGSADVDAVTNTIATAFHDDPVWSWAFPDLERRSTQLAVWWGFWVDAAIRSGEVWMTESCEAATVWIQPGGVECTPVDAEHMPAYLESSNPANHARYRRLGFEPTGEFQPPGSCPPVLTMWRAAR